MGRLGWNSASRIAAIYNRKCTIFSQKLWDMQKKKRQESVTHSKQNEGKKNGLWEHSDIKKKKNLKAALYICSKN